MPFMLFNNSIADRQAKAGAFSAPFSGKKWIKDMGQVLIFNTRSGVLYFYDSLIIHFTEFDFEGSPFGHGINGIEDNVDEDLLEPLSFPPQRFHRRKI
ncbi:hypothetical protein ES703_64588 [subsurface metagenome]